MGIKGLLPRLTDIHQAINLKNLDGSTIGIDGAAWLYQVLYPCSLDLYKKQATTRYISLFEKGIQLLLDHNIKPVVIFDGEQIPAKAKTKEKRRKKIQEARKKADIAMRNKDLDAAESAARQAIEITDGIVSEIMQVLSKLDVPYMVAPYEADAQLAYMNQVGVIDYVMTEDSDLLAYGAQRVIYKWDRHRGVGCLIEARDLWRVLSYTFTKDSFILMCVLSGCDYLESLPRIGIKRAENYIATATDLYEELENIGTFNNVRVHVPESYMEAVQRACMVFKHQIVYDYGSDILCPCTPYSTDFPDDFGNYAGDISTEGREETIAQNHLEYVWFSEEDMMISRASDTSWAPDDVEQEEEPASEESRYPTRQAGQTHNIKSISEVVEWVVPGLPVLTLPLLLTESEGGELVAICLLEDEEVPTVCPFQIFCTSSCYIDYKGQRCILFWKWHTMFQEAEIEQECEEEEETASFSSQDEWDQSSEEEGDDVVVLVDDEEEDEEANRTPHCVGFKVMGVTATNARQDALLEAKYQMSLGNKVEALLKPEPSNPHDANAIQVVLGIGDRIELVGYISSEMTKYVHLAINNNTIRGVAIEHVKFRAFNPPGYYMRLLITKQGRWHNLVVRKSLRAK